jgi:hypothetical protein
MMQRFPPSARGKSPRLVMDQIGRGEAELDAPRQPGVAAGRPPDAEGSTDAVSDPNSQAGLAKRNWVNSNDG